MLARVNASLAPGFLVASPSLRCPFFERAVVLLIDHGPEGSFGFVVNKATDMSMDDVLRQVGVDSRSELSRTQVLQGGPVAPEAGWILYDADGEAVPTQNNKAILIDEHLVCSASLDVLRSMANDHAPRRSLMVLGYAGWGAGQLEAEMRQGSWIPVDLSHQLVFDTPIARRWDTAFATLGIDPARMVDQQVAQA